MSGTLYVVATPIGNLQDITLRAIETLKSVELIACEDTRRTAVLLKAHEIRTPTTSYYSYSSPAKEASIIDALREGRSVGLISDAGLPGISDPGVPLIRKAIEAHIPVTVIPGSSALLVGLVLSGFPTDKFVFEGFLSSKPGARTARLTALKDEPRTIVLYESPHRLTKMLADIEAVFGDIPISVSRELTKKFEETRRDRVSSLRDHFERQAPQGEFVIVLPPKRLRG